jgi:hypothetical protein
VPRMAKNAPLMRPPKKSQMGYRPELAGRGTPRIRRTQFGISNMTRRGSARDQGFPVSRMRVVKTFHIMGARGLDVVMARAPAFNPTLSHPMQTRSGH